MVDGEVPMVILETTLATIVSVVLAELGSGVIVGTVDTFLLRETSRVSGIVTTCQATLKSGHGTEGPTGTTATLVLDRVHSAVSNVIDVHVAAEIASKTISHRKTVDSARSSTT